MPLTALVAGVLSAQAAKPVEVPFIIGDNAIIARATVNGREVSTMFDTGFSGAFVLSDNVNIGKPTGTMNLRDFVGQFEAATVDIKSLSIGSQKIRPDGLTVVQQPRSSYSLSYNTHAIGIMGMEVMRDFVLEINMERSRFIFHPKSFDFTKRVPDNKRTFMVRMKPKGNDSAELVVETQDGKKMNLALDTGNAFYATTHKDVLERIGLWRPGQRPRYIGTSMVASGPVDSFYVEMKNLKIYGVPVERSIWNIIDLPSSGAEHDGTVGFGFLRNFNVIMDFQRRRVWLENWTGKVSEPPTASVGISAWFFPGIERFVVTNVTPEGPAAKAGIRRGDQLLSIDGAEALDIGPRALAALLEGPENSKVKIALSRNGALMRFELERKYLLNLLQTAPAPAAASAGSSGQ